MLLRQREAVAAMPHGAGAIPQGAHSPGAGPVIFSGAPKRVLHAGTDPNRPAQNLHSLHLTSGMSLPCRGTFPESSTLQPQTTRLADQYTQEMGDSVSLAMEVVIRNRH